MVLPLSLPGVLTTGILTFVASWNSYLLPLFVLSDPNRYTLPLGVQQFHSAHGSDTAAVLAFTSLSMIPALVFFTAFERRIVGGLQGAVKADPSRWVTRPHPRHPPRAHQAPYLPLTLST